MKAERNSKSLKKYMEEQRVQLGRRGRNNQDQQAELEGEITSQPIEFEGNNIDQVEPEIPREHDRQPSRIIDLTTSSENDKENEINSYSLYNEALKVFNAVYNE